MHDLPAELTNTVVLRGTRKEAERSLKGYDHPGEVVARTTAGAAEAAYWGYGV